MTVDCEPWWQRAVPEEWRALLNGIRPSRRPAAAAVYALAGAQRQYAAGRIGDWPIPASPGTAEVRVFTLACERDRVLLMRMVSSLLARVGTPRSFTVVSDGSITPTTAAAVRRLSPVIDITESSELLESSWVPESVRRFAHSHVLGIKLAIMMRPVDGAACLFVDTDVEFHAGGRRLLGYLGDLEQGPRFMEHPEWIDGVGVPNTYDPRLLEGRDVLPRVNSGVVIWSRALEWSDALERIEPIADQALALSEQTAVALALSDSGARVLPAQEFVLVADDGGSPFDRHTGERTILRHYFSIGLQWKMNLKGGPSGMRSAPAAVLTALARSLRDQSREGARSRS